VKIVRIGFIALISGSLFLMGASERVDLSLKSGKQQVTNPEARPGTIFPSFLEKGKTYFFSFSGVGMAGRVEKIDAGSGWVYINHYVYKRKEIITVGKFEGYSWININLVYQITDFSHP
jgi:hypothetical protein